MGDDKDDASNVSNVLNQIAAGADIINESDSKSDPETDSKVEVENKPSFDVPAPAPPEEPSEQENEDLSLQEKLLKNKIPLLIIFVVWVVGMFVVFGSDTPEPENKPVSTSIDKPLDETFEIGANDESFSDDDTNVAASGQNDSTINNTQIERFDDLDSEALLEPDSSEMLANEPEEVLEFESDSNVISENSSDRLNNIIEDAVVNKNKVDNESQDLEGLSPPTEQFLTNNNLPNTEQSESGNVLTLDSDDANADVVVDGSTDASVDDKDETNSNSESVNTIDDAIETEVTISGNDFTSLVEKIDTMVEAQAETTKEVKSLKWQVGKLSNAKKFKVAPVLKVITTVPAAKNCPECVSHARVDFDNSKKLVGSGDMLFGYRVDISGDRLNLLDGKNNTVFSYWVEK
jgi:hypothetical protein